ncbi:metallophosphatase [Iodidimonas gelatinilytica]|uniref:Metallophosphatase n=1 Tax=Iodidimonas gelatinilytica TaxID=1236966 RepID=A0A5A7MPL8_9PROT|nr:metallophosphoesterase [Iodidimonas gelatinilytica]GEQ97143.1 metallophosphatase [Iodidimonas gelatinilytica]GEQ99474.1 metallophosphatase [Iodidimonas gelatinilytica]
MFTLAHISDLHFPPLPPASAKELLSKRILGYLSWHRKRKHEHCATVLEALLDELKANPTDHICVTGDLTNIALPQEFKTAQNWLERLGKAEDISIIPGNHDAYVKGALDRGMENWRQWMTSDAGAPDQLCHPQIFPFVRRRDGVSIIGTSTAVATLPALASGRLGEDQRDALEALLQAEHKARQFTIIMIHHPPQPGAESPRKALSDGAPFRKMIARTGAGLILHGHTHRALVSQIDGPHGPVPVLGCGSSSSIGSHRGPGHYYRIQLNPKTPSAGIKVESRHFDATKTRFFPAKSQTLIQDSHAALSHG